MTRSKKKLAKKASVKKAPVKKLSDDDYILRHGFTQARITQMKSRHIDWTAIMRKGSFLNLEKAITRVEAENDSRGHYRSVSKNQQLDTLDRVMEHPLRGTYVLGIGSVSTDLAAKQLALSLFDIAWSQQINNPRYSRKDPPLWYHIYGSLHDRLRDEFSGRPSMLILSGLAANSLALKMEKLRDILYKYRDIPRIVVIGGQDPISFFAEKVHSPLKAGLFLVDTPECRRRTW